MSLTTTADQFTIDGQDDYMIALGTFYKEKGTAGNRYLIETTTGAYTAITGSEKADMAETTRSRYYRNIYSVIPSQQVLHYQDG